MQTKRKTGLHSFYLNLGKNKMYMECVVISNILVFFQGKGDATRRKNCLIPKKLRFLPTVAAIMAKKSSKPELATQSQ